jgi:isocitrate dehydrogenase (NAD+)
VYIYDTYHYDKTQTVTLVPGDGVGQELAESVKAVFKAAEVPIEWEQFDLSG